MRPLRNTVSQARNFLVVIGDLNGRLETDKLPYSYHDKINRNGNYLIELWKNLVC